MLLIIFPMETDPPLLGFVIGGLMLIFVSWWFNKDDDHDVDQDDDHEDRGIMF